MLTRTGRLVVLVAGALLLLRLPRLGDTLAALGSPRFPTALVAWLELALLGVATWTAVLGLLAALGGPGAARAARLLPRALVAAGAVGVLVAGPASADDARSPVTPRSLDGLALPDRPFGGTTATPDPVPEPTGSAGDVHVVRRGESLWSIAAERLEPGAPPDRVARLVVRMHRANRAVVGDDPDLVLPGQRLVVPAVRS